MDRRASSYTEYLKVAELLRLQERLSDEHDEMLFIVIHQVYELWFREMIHEAEEIMVALRAGRIRPATRLYRRLIEIQRVLLQQVAVLETMAPSEFNAFRDRLNPASGFQSSQFRELEFLSGMKEKAYLGMPALTEGDVARLKLRFDGPTLGDAFDDVLRARGFALPVGPLGASSPQRIEALVTIYDHHEDHDDLFQLCEAMIEYDENFQLWRFHHVRMVERMIGRKKGTGGSDGVGYLQKTLDKRCFPDLWEVRTHLKGGDYGG